MRLFIVDKDKLENFTPVDVAEQVTLFILSNFSVSVTRYTQWHIVFYIMNLVQENRKKKERNIGCCVLHD